MLSIVNNLFVCKKKRNLLVIYIKYSYTACNNFLEIIPFFRPVTVIFYFYTGRLWKKFSNRTTNGRNFQQ